MRRGRCKLTDHELKSPGFNYRDFFVRFLADLRFGVTLMPLFDVDAVNLLVAKIPMFPSFLELANEESVG